MRRLLSRILLACCLTLALASVPAAAQTANPFTPLPQPAPSTETVETTSSTTRTTDDGLERWQEVAIFLAGLALLAGIGIAIVRDARKVAPVTEDELRGGGHTQSAAGARKAHSKAKNRKKGKAQRQARKHNR